MIKIDNFYFVVEDINKSINFYTKIFDKKPTNITEDRWADWENVLKIDGQIGKMRITRCILV